MWQSYKYKETKEEVVLLPFPSPCTQGLFHKETNPTLAMHTARHLLRRRERGSFMTVHLDDEAFGEVCGDFYLQFQAELGPLWTLYDINGKSHQIAFNRNAASPRLTHGWMNLRKFYQFTGDRIIYLGYLGDSVFRIDIFQEEALPHHFPWYHSKSMKGRPIFFQVTLSHEAVSRTRLPLKNDFAKFVSKLGYRSLFLRGPFIDIPCSVLIGEDGYGTVRLGNGWRIFLDLNRFRKGQKLRFQFMNVDFNNAVTVTRI